MHSPAPPFAHTLGPRTAEIAIVGEAWGEQEEKAQRPFIGYSGQELTRMLTEAGIERKDCFLTNVFAFRPPRNEIEALCGSKAEVGKDYPLKSIRQGKYIKQEYLGELYRLSQELEEVKPNIVIALGNIACWALLNSSGITSLRGTTTESDHLGPKLKVLPTYHPAAVLRNWSWRPIVIADLMKAKKESKFPSISRPHREILYDPTLDEIREWMHTHGLGAEILAVDTETKRGQIEMVGFSTGPTYACVVPFVDFRKPGNNYWHDPTDEVTARMLVQKLLTTPAKKIFQNGLYDLQYFLREGFTLRNVAEDTMLLHHAMFPELPKGLGFLGSIYTNESSWKLLNRGRSDELKKDE